MREAFLLDPDLVFLNHGSFGACPREVFRVYQDWQLALERNPVEFLGRRSAALLMDARAQLAAYLGAAPEHLVFLPNATTGVNTVARALDLRPGDEVLGTDHEYGACDETWRRVCAGAGAHYRLVEVPLPFERARFADRLLAEVGPRTRLIFSSHITSVTALTFPLAELCARARQMGVLTLIDGAHAPGQLDLDLDALGADFYTGNCHKWLCAPKGSAFLHARPEHHERLQGLIVSWGHVDQGRGHEAYAGASWLERHLQWQGTRDIAAWLTVPAAIAFQQRHDWGGHRTRCHALAGEALREVVQRYGLAPIGQDADWLQMVTLPVPHHDAEALRAALFARGIEIPVTQHAGQRFVRLSVQAYNDADDIARLLAALDQVAP
ncbi:isopenicillin-N epimerase [Roseateles toxinivorans]|uniref:Isopenicillin-N epimerase n=2 Tax=Roseateles toxinivorans TaxID=270368 RepID=A0A4R6QB90_9BURK|nr:isopenicillin-N epimerase [Roseateles toxinivorans]